jgi:hypothetical protein
MRGRSKIGNKLARGQKNVITDQRTLLIEKREKEKAVAKAARDAEERKKGKKGKGGKPEVEVPKVLQRFGKK